MCQQLMTRVKMLCGHEIENPGIKIPCSEGCGVYKPNWSAGSATKKDPCDDYIDERKWVKDENGKWGKT